MKEKGIHVIFIIKVHLRFLESLLSSLGEFARQDWPGCQSSDRHLGQRKFCVK